MGPCSGRWFLWALAFPAFSSQHLESCSLAPALHLDPSGLTAETSTVVSAASQVADIPMRPGLECAVDRNAHLLL